MRKGGNLPMCEVISKSQVRIPKTAEIVACENPPPARDALYPPAQSRAFPMQLRHIDAGSAGRSFA